MSDHTVNQNHADDEPLCYCPSNDEGCSVCNGHEPDDELPPTKPDRRCRKCGATSGLVMLPYGPLDPPKWECTDGCPTTADEDDEDTTGQMALIRQLLAHAKAAGYTHATYGIVNSAAGRDQGPIEHNWRTLGREHEITYYCGYLTYHRQSVLLLSALVDSPQQVALLLAAFGVVPPALTPAYEAGQLAAAADIDAMVGGAR